MAKTQMRAAKQPAAAEEETAQAKPQKKPDGKKWGVRAAQVYEQFRDREVCILFRDGTELVGALAGVDTYEYVLVQDGGQVLVQKGSVRCVRLAGGGG
jgi:small nuclear ribonucleoprotein (snRNP)-like protein